jgi:phosphoribosyl 1,2-cyclic phosphodiesterase
MMATPVPGMPDGQLHLTFLGTRGKIERRSRRHGRHSALLIESSQHRVMLDCGADWLARFGALRPSAILLTHAHPDHARGLAEGAPCPVYATAETWTGIGRYPIADRRVIQPGRRFCLGAIVFQAFAVEHSIRAPAVGYRIATDRAALFYVPDVVAIRDRTRALRDVGLYIGDGATITRPLVRRRGEMLIGHTTIRAQLGWCRDAGIAQAIFTHCGSEIVDADGRSVAAQVRCLGRDRGVAVRIAHDGMRCVFPSREPVALAVDPGQCRPSYTCHGISMWPCVAS